MNRLSAATLALLTLAAAACRKKAEPTASVETVAVARHDIVVDAEATGTVEPINVVEIKSKASGQIVKMPVDIGSSVRAGDLLVQIDTRDVKNQYDQALATVRAAEAKLAVSESQKRRSDELFRQQFITAQEHESAALDLTQSQAALVAARASLDIAKQRLEDATVRAPVAGTVIAKDVSLGQVISSATGSVSGGTTILKMADLNQVRVRALVDETDIGSVKVGQLVTVTVDAYPDRPFQGLVEKIEPQAVVDQSVTMFPVLVSIANREGLLMPGMNGEVAIHVERRDNVLAVPTDAVRNPREAMQVASLLGVPPESLQALSPGGRGRGGRNGGGNGSGAGNGAGGAGNGGSRTSRTSGGDVALISDPAEGVPAAQAPGQGAAPGANGGARMQLPVVTDAECAKITATLAKNAAAAAELDSIRSRVMSGAIDRQAAREQSQAVYRKLGLDGPKVLACRFRARAAQGGPQGGPQGGQEGAAAGAPQMSIPGDNFGTRRGTPGVAFVKQPDGHFSPRFVRLGVSNYDFVEVLSGLQEGEQVALLGGALLQAQREQRTEFIRQRMGGGVPGMQRQQGSGGSGGGGGGGSRPSGGAPGGGGGR